MSYICLCGWKPSPGCVIHTNSNFSKWQCPDCKTWHNKEPIYGKSASLIIIDDVSDEPLSKCKKKDLLQWFNKVKLLYKRRIDNEKR
jgi:hypothetical protein